MHFHFALGAFLAIFPIFVGFVGIVGDTPAIYLADFGGNFWPFLNTFGPFLDHFGAGKLASFAKK